MVAFLFSHSLFCFNKKYAKKKSLYNEYNFGRISSPDRYEMFVINMSALENFIAVCRGGKLARFCHLSSHVYLPLRFTSPIDPLQERRVLPK